MSRFFDLVSKPARDMGTTNAPSPTAAALERRSRLIKLDSNESPFGPSPRAIEAMRGAIMTSNFYPDDDCNQLRVKLAAHHGVSPEQVLVTAGSTAITDVALPDIARPGAERSDERAVVHCVRYGGACCWGTIDRDSDARGRFRSRGYSGRN